MKKSPPGQSDRSSRAPGHLWARAWAILRIQHGSEVVRLAAPIMVAQLSHTLMWTVDTALLGHASSLALAAAGFGGIITWTMYSLFNNLNRITNTFVSQAHGRGDDESASDYSWQGIYVAIATGLVLQVMGALSYLVLPLTRHAADLQAMTYVYIKWRTASAVFTQLAFCLSGFYQGRKDVKTPMWAGIVGNVINVLLDVWLIFGWSGLPLAGVRLLAIPALGVKGAAIATSVSTFVTTAILAARLLPEPLRRRYAMHRPRRPSRRKLQDLIRIGSPSAWEGFIDMTGFMVFSSFIGRTGAVALAASQITIQLLAFSFMPMWGIASAGAILAGNWLGAGRPDQARLYGRQVYKLGLYYVLTLAILLLALRREVFVVFSDDPLVVAMGASLVLVAAVFQIFDGMRMIAIGFLSGSGDTRFPMLLSLCVLWGLFIPLTYGIVVVRGGNLIAAWLGGTCCYLLQALMLYWRFHSGRWQHIRIWSAAGPPA